MSFGAGLAVGIGCGMCIGMGSGSEAKKKEYKKKILQMMNNGYLNVTDNNGNKISGEKLLFYIENTKT